MPLAFVEYDLDTGDPLRDASGRVRQVPDGEPGLLLSRVNRLQPFDGYTDPVASERSWCATLSRWRLLVQHR